ncbi:MAG TPA: hypothetical protein VKB81_08330 [Nitrospira sp.]|nr:hypothetical protein [Nitrospira sp.]
MQPEATRTPIKYRLKTGEEVTLRPGVPTELPEPAATQLLRKARDNVRLVDGGSTLQPSGVVIESAVRNARPVFWESMDGVWHGAGEARISRTDGIGSK